MKLRSIWIQLLIVRLALSGVPLLAATTEEVVKECKSIWNAPYWTLEVKRERISRLLFQILDEQPQAVEEIYKKLDAEFELAIQKSNCRLLRKAFSWIRFKSGNEIPGDTHKSVSNYGAGVSCRSILTSCWIEYKNEYFRNRLDLLENTRESFLNGSEDQTITTLGDISDFILVDPAEAVPVEHSELECVPETVLFPHKCSLPSGATPYVLLCRFVKKENAIVQKTNRFLDAVSSK